MSLTSIGIDPGSDYLGLGAVWLDDDGLCIHAELHRIRVTGLSLPETVAKVDLLLRPLVREAVILSWEQPPPTVRKDTNHKFQAAIGYRLGLIAGAVISPYLKLPNVEARETEVSKWRDNILSFAAINGPALGRPTRRGLVKNRVGEIGPGLQSPLTSVPGDGWIGTYSCRHEIVLKTFSDVQKAPKTCPQCTNKTVAAQSDPAKEIRDSWKRLACQVVKEHFPVQYEDLLVPAREAARKKNSLDHQLLGVSDACEALCIAISALPQVEPLRKVSGFC